MRCAFSFDHFHEVSLRLVVDCWQSRICTRAGLDLGFVFNYCKQTPCSKCSPNKDVYCATLSADALLSFYHWKGASMTITRSSREMHTEVTHVICVRQTNDYRIDEHTDCMHYIEQWSKSIGYGAFLCCFQCFTIECIQNAFTETASTEPMSPKSKIYTIKWAIQKTFGCGLCVPRNVGLDFHGLCAGITIKTKITSEADRHELSTDRMTINVN